MRIAICISGHLRGFEHTAPSFLSNLARGAETDVFIHTWDKIGHAESWHGSDARNKQNTADCMAKVAQIYNPKAVTIEQTFQWDMSQYAPVALGPVNRNVPTMFYKIKACNDLKSAHEERHGFKYDLVVRTRADIVYHSRIDLPALDRDKLHMPAVPAMYGCPSGANDQIAVGSSANMDAYASAIDSLHDWTRTIIGEDAGAAFRPERFLRWHVNRTGVPTERLAARYSLHRLNGRHVAIQ